MKVLFVDNSGAKVNIGCWDFGDRHVRRMILSCRAALSHATHLVSYRGENNGVATAARTASEESVLPVAVPASGRMRKLAAYLRSWPLVWRAVADAQICYVFYPGHLTTLALLAAMAQGKPFGVYLRGELGLRSRFSRVVFSRARFVIAEGKVLADWAGRFCKDVELAAPVCELSLEDVPREKTARTHGPWNILFVGYIWRRKGCYELLQAAAALRQRGVDFNLYMVGQNALEEYPDCFGAIRDRVCFTGHIADRAQLRRYYQQADLFCLPSHDEGFPRVLYEAMLYKVPIVTTFVGSIPGLMKDGENCLRVEVGNPQQLADVIQRALDDCALRQRLMDNGLRTVEPIVRKMMEESCDQQLLRKLRQYARSEAG
jgi:glycosyltransferase involved in cell wall biosynthesis